MRHAIPGLRTSAWTPESVSALCALLCTEPLGRDPIPLLAEGDDWVGWMTRKRLLDAPRDGDGAWRRARVQHILRDQLPDGSWGTVPATAYAMLRLLALGQARDDGPVRRAAAWLLALPDVAPRPGMWMLMDAYRDEWVGMRRPAGDPPEPCGFQWTGPGRTSYYCRDFAVEEQDQFRGEAMQRVIPTCARHHLPACEPRLTHVSSLIAEALLRCGFAEHPRLRRYVNTLMRVGGVWGYWCGCGALGLTDADLPALEDEPDLNLRRGADDGRHDVSPWRWVAEESEVAGLAERPTPTRIPLARAPGVNVRLEPFRWHTMLGAASEEGDVYALLGSGWQNGDCWAKTNHALAAHPGYAGSLAEEMAIHQASRYQTSLGVWDQGFPSGLLSFLSLLDHPAAAALVAKTVPWLRAHQAEDGLWHEATLYRSKHGALACPPSPRLATYHIVRALRHFGLYDRLVPR